MSVRAYFCACICLAPAHCRAFVPSALMDISYPESISEVASMVEAVLLLEADRRVLNRRRVLNMRRVLNQEFDVSAFCIDVGANDG